MSIKELLDVVDKDKTVLILNKYGDEIGMRRGKSLIRYDGKEEDIADQEVISISPDMVASYPTNTCANYFFSVRLVVTIST